MYISDIRHPRPALKDKLQALYRLDRGRHIDMSFRPPYLELLRAFGNPHRNLPPLIHVAGTNGKGSIIAALRAIFEAAGLRVHTYTSPHLCAFNERIELAGRAISDSALETLIDEALALNAGREITFFEITTAMAFAAFSRVPADILLLETGMGGRLDCTNVVEKPLATIISTVSLDHTEHLGGTLEAIAAEKAGIMKRGVPCIIGRQIDDPETPDLFPAFAQKGREKGAKLYSYGSEWFVEDHGRFMRFSFDGRAADWPKPNLAGKHQIYNAGAALAALEVIADQRPVPSGARRRGLQNIRWPARLQPLEDHPLRTRLPAGWELWLDGGHNDSAGAALAAQAEEWEQTAPKRLHLIMGMLAHKNPESFLRPLLPHLASLTIVDIPDEPAALNAAALAERLGPLLPDGFRAGDARSPDAALQKLASGGKGPGRVLIAGSIYLAGHVLKLSSRKRIILHNDSENPP